MRQSSLQAPQVPSEYARQIVDPAAYSGKQSVHDAFRWLRANVPLGIVDLPAYDPFWVVTRHAYVREISFKNNRFSSSRRASTLVSRADDARTRAMLGGSPHLLRNIVTMDNPEHLKYRSITQEWFMPQSIRRLEPRIRALARAHVERMVALGGRCDFVADISLYYPLRVIMGILGVPPEDEPRMLKLTQELFGARDPELRRKRTAADAATDPNKTASLSIADVLRDFSDYFTGITNERVLHPRDDLATVIANARVDGSPITDAEISGYFTVIATAGHDTTSASTAGAIWALAENPEQFAKLKANSELIPGLVDEAIRWSTPVKHFMRTAVEDYEIGGATISAGDWVMLSYASANRDETVFNEPFNFSVGRQSKHLAFGFGGHSCLGQHLARLEMQILFEELLPRIKSLELAGEPTSSQSIFISGPKSLPIRYEVVA
jgi:cytochrome P450